MIADLRDILDGALRRLSPKSEMALGKDQITFPNIRRARSCDKPLVIASLTARSAASRSASGSLIRSINQSAV